MSDTSNAAALGIAARGERAVRHPLEREAVTLLARAGWTRGELAMTFQCSESSIGRLLAAEGVER